MNANISASVVERLKQEQRDRWKYEDRVEVEEFLTRYPPLGKDVDAVLDLIDMEVVLRQRRGESPSLTEYLPRFPDPDFDKPLRELFGLQECLDAAGLANTQRFREVDATDVFEASTDDDQVSLKSIGQRYWLERRLGVGGYGKVYLAFDNLLKRKVAIKLASPKVRGSQEHLQSEAHNAAQLHHPNIVAIYDFGSADGQPYMVSRFVSGENLQQRIQRGKPTVAEALDWVIQIADALHYAHRNDIIHRDVKPSNILMDHANGPQLTDFGLAVRYVDLANEKGKISGTRFYLSPEIILGKGHQIDSRTDIYSLGVVLFQLLCGRLPFEHDDCIQLFDAICSQEPRRPRRIDPTIPQQVELSCLKAMAKSVADRYTTAGDFADDLRSALMSLVEQRGDSGVSALLLPALRTCFEIQHSALSSRLDMRLIMAM